VVVTTVLGAPSIVQPAGAQQRERRALSVGDPRRSKPRVAVGRRVDQHQQALGRAGRTARAAAILRADVDRGRRDDRARRKIASNSRA
jgi:hypothetical protein